MTDLELRRGDKRTITIQATRPEGSTWTLDDLTAIQFTVKRDIDDSDAEAVFTKTLGNGIEIDDEDLTRLTAIVTILKADWPVRLVGPLVWDIEGLDSDGEPVTLDSGAITVTLDVTRSQEAP